MFVQGWDEANSEIRVNLQGIFNCCGLYAYNMTRVNPPQSNADNQPCPDKILHPDSEVGCMGRMVDQFHSAFTTAGACGIA